MCFFDVFSKFKSCDGKETASPSPRTREIIAFVPRIVRNIWMHFVGKNAVFVIRNKVVRVVTVVLFEALKAICFLCTFLEFESKAY
jgi:hypothetical protein